MKISIYRLFTPCLLLAGVMFACTEDDPEALRRGGKGNDPSATDPNANGQDPNGDPALCKGKDHAGFEARNLNQDRPVQKFGTDRARIKPFEALSDDYARVLGVSPASLKGAGPTFGQSPARWYDEPESNAVALQTAYSIAFDGCLEYVAKAPGMQQEPNADSAAAACGAMARKFWNRTASSEEIQSCANVALTGSKEPQAPRKWASACASVLTSAGFLTY